MNLTESTWAEVTDWFNRLVDLAPEQRAQRIEQSKIGSEARLWLERMFEAHDSPEPLLVDQAVDALIADLSAANDAAKAKLPADWSGQRLGHWQIVREIKRGGMASVMLAERIDGTYERQVAIKVLHPGSHPGRNEASLRHEIQMLARLSHPGIINLIDGGVTEDGWPYLVMEYVVGESIDQWCEQNQPSLQQRVEMLRQIASALMHAHRQLIVHADIKPSNVLVEADTRVRLVDFGIARLTQSDQTEPKLTTLMGSPAWAAPEQLLGQPPTVSNDVFGLGMVMYTLLAGQRLRQGSQITRILIDKTVDQTAVAPSTAEPQLFPASQLRGDLDAICLKALSEDPTQRYASIESLDQDLERWQQGYPVQAHPGGWAYRCRKWLSRHTLPAAAAAVAVVALLGGSSLALWQAERAQDEAARATLQAERAQTIKDFLLSMFKSADPWEAGGDELDTREVLRQGARQIESMTELDPTSRVELLTTLAGVHTALGWHEDARSLLGRAFLMFESNPELPVLVQTEVWFEQALLESKQSHFDEAEQALNRVKAMLEPAQDAALGLLPLRVEVQFAGLYARQNRAAEAEQSFQRADRLLAETTASAIEQRRNLSSARGILAFNQGNLDQAYQHMLDALDLEAQTGNLEQGTMVQALSNLAAVAGQLGRLDEALAHDQRAAELSRQVYPPGHPGIATALYALGDTLRLHGRFDEALVYLNEAVAIQRDADLDVSAGLTDNVRARTLLALGQGLPAATAAAAARGVLESNWSPTARSVLQALEFELAGYAMAGAEDQFLTALTLAEQRLEQTESPARWEPVAQLLRWRIAWELYKRREYSASGRWLREAQNAPEEVARHPTARLRLEGLELLLTQQPEPPVGIRDAASLIESIQSELENPAAHADAQAFALCALAITQQRDRNHQAQGESQARLQDLTDATGLTSEGRQFVQCNLDRLSESG